MINELEYYGTMYTKQPQCTACGMGDSYSFSLDINKLGRAKKISSLRPTHVIMSLAQCSKYTNFIFSEKCQELNMAPHD